jgi:tetratricopeptide (TPR) repeat protein
MARTPGNTRLKAARVAAGYATQQALADALNSAGPQLGLGHLDVSVRQVRRWESESPPWPQAHYQRALRHVLGMTMEELGFTPTWGAGGSPQVGPPVPPPAGGAATSAALPLPGGAEGHQPASAAADYAVITAAHRRLYWTMQPAHMHPTVVEHMRLGTALMAETTGGARITLARALAESSLMAGRLEFFDLQDPDAAADTYVRALQAAGEANDALLGAAILAHSAFIPGWVGERARAQERLRAARSYARRGRAGAELLAWLDAVEAECETRCGNPRTALNLIGHAEDVLASGSEPGAAATPEWMDWFSPVRLHAFKGTTQIRAGHYAQARATLLAVLDDLPDSAGKQRAVVLGDLAAVAAAERKPEEACDWALKALNQLSVTWYATGMDRVRDVRTALHPWNGHPRVAELDDEMFGWRATVSALQR